MNWREFQTRQRVVEFADRFMSYVEEGSGEAVLLLHGIPTWGYLWHGLVPALAERRLVLIPDLAGFGYSEKGDHFDRSIAQQTVLIDEFLGRKGIDRAVVIGHDIGGGVALRLAAMYPNRVKRLCLINTVCYDSWPIPEMLQFGNPDTYKKLPVSKALLQVRQLVKSGFTRPPTEDLLDGLLAPYGTETGKLSLIRNASALNTNHTTELTPMLPRLDVPTRILWGEEDEFHRVKYGERLAGDIPGARLTRIPNARHFPMIDRLQTVTGHVAEFLQ